MRDTLLLNADFSPMGILAWQRALALVLEGKATALEVYPGQYIRSPTRRFPWPAVVYLRDYVRIRRTPGPTRKRVLARDDFRCQYCGTQPVGRTGIPDTTRLTIDHIVPRSQARAGRVRVGDRWIHLSSWQNVVTACVPCNQRKAARTPAQAGMRLLRVPRVPHPSDAVRIALARCAVPAQWRPFLRS